MTANLWLGSLTALALSLGSAWAGTVEVDVTDAHGHPLADAVIELSPADSSASVPAAKPPAQGVIDQRHETFLPLVTLIRKGGRVIFTNNDTTMHQVYSFSDIKQFAFEIDEGEHSQPVVFDKPGVVAIGCNIHDQMITYVYVTEQPFAGLSNSLGLTTMADVPDGKYHGTVWHPQLRPGSRPPAFDLVVAGAKTHTSIALPVTATTRKTSMHMQMY
jgi:plastocyanin